MRQGTVGTLAFRSEGSFAPEAVDRDDRRGRLESEADEAFAVLQDNHLLLRVARVDLSNAAAIVAAAGIREGITFHSHHEPRSASN